MAEPHSGEMPEVLTDGWVAWLDSVLSGCRVDDAVDLVMEHRVVDVDGFEFCWHVRLGGGRASAVPGLADSGSRTGRVRFTSNRETARSMAVEGESAQRAFAEGRLRLDGDPQLLLAARPALEMLGAALAAPT